MRAVRPGSIQAAVRESITAAGGLECASNDLGLSIASLSRASVCDEERPGGLGVNHLHRLGRILPETAVPIAKHFATLAGGVFQEIPVKGQLVASIHSLTKEFSDVLGQHAQAHSEASSNPDRFTKSEAREAIKEVTDLIEAAMSYRLSLEAELDE